MKITKLIPPTKDYIWGGVKLKEIYNKKSDKDIIAESWELSCHKDGKSMINDSEYLSDVLTNEALGTNVLDFPFFPVLIKFIDAKDNLSVQVHPSDEYALKYENSLGKTEMWYIIDADQGAGIYLGFKRKTNREEVEERIKNNTLMEILNFIPVSKGDCYFIPAGTIHAIGKGVLIAEVQQNSNITYRVYDYDRRDKFGNPRELHISKALDVINYSHYLVKKQRKTTKNVRRLASSRYFTTFEYSVNGEINLATTGKSFHSISFISGEGMINGQPFTKGDTFFVPADFGSYKINGDALFILTKIEKLYVGVDLGGTNIKAGVISDFEEVLSFEKVKTEASLGSEHVLKNIQALVKKVLLKCYSNLKQIEGVGIGLPGIIDEVSGRVPFSNNINWLDVDVCGPLSKALNTKLLITNDANAAALGEKYFGSSKNAKCSVLITLGTGVGSGIIIDNKIFSGNMGAGAELGHMIIRGDKNPCNCGRVGCLESLVSATALIKEVKEYVGNPQSDLYNKVSLESITGRTAFDLASDSNDAKKIINEYLDNLKNGLINIANIFRPEMILIGGGISNCLHKYISQLNKDVNKEVFGKNLGPKVEIKIAKMKNDAGFIGAACLFKI